MSRWSYSRPSEPSISHALVLGRTIPISVPVMMLSRKALSSSGHEIEWVTPDVRAPSHFVVELFLTDLRRRFQPFLVIPRDALVALRQRHEFFAADDVIDILERLVARAAVDFVQDCIGRRTAVCQHHLAGRRQTLGFIDLERLDRVGMALRASDNARASRMACAPPLAPRGYIGCAASPSSVRRPKLQRGSGSWSTIGYSRIGRMRG